MMLQNHTSYRQITLYKDQTKDFKVGEQLGIKDTRISIMTAFKLLKKYEIKASKEMSN